MIFNMVGGADLNFEVVGGTTQPTNPKENTIWVKTRTDITSWVFSSEQPTFPVAGMVWLLTATSSDNSFNALKKNELSVAVVSVSQYVSGAWALCDSLIYQNGHWKTFAEYILSASVDKSNGWKYYNAGSGPSAVKNSDGSYTLTRPNESSYGYLFVTNNSFDLTPYKTMRWRIISAGANAENWVGVIDPTMIGSSNTLRSYTAINNGAGEYSLDITSLSGAHAIGANLDYRNGILRIADIRLEG